MPNILQLPNVINETAINYEDNLKWPKIQNNQIYLPTDDLQSVGTVANEPYAIAVYKYHVNYPSEMVRTEVGQYREPAYIKIHYNLFLFGQMFQTQESLFIAKIDHDKIYRDNQLLEHDLANLEIIYQQLTPIPWACERFSLQPESSCFIKYVKLPFDLNEWNKIHQFEKNESVPFQNTRLDFRPYSIQGKIYKNHGLNVYDAQILYKEFTFLDLSSLHQVTIPFLTFLQ